MKRARFLISSLSLAGFGLPDAAQAQFIHAVTTTGGDDPNRTKLVQRFTQEHRFILAGHRSHSSHSSHSSHRSGSGGGYSYPRLYSPTPVPRYTPTPTPRSSTPRPTPSRDYTPSPLFSPTPLSGRTERFQDIARRVQLGLKTYGYYDGVIDGVVGVETRAALTRFQTDFTLKVTGTITPEVLDALKIVAD